MKNNTANRRFIAAVGLLAWCMGILVLYTVYHPEHTRPWYHFGFFANDIIWFLVIVFISAGLGRLILLRLIAWTPDTVLLECVCSFVVGFAVLGYTYLLLGTLGLINRWIVLVVLLAYSGVSWKQLLLLRKRIVSAFPGEFQQALSSPLCRLLFIIIVVQAVLNGISSMTPPYEWDTLSYHLQCQKEYITAGTISRLPYIHQSFYPCGVELVYGISLLMRSHIAPKLLHCFMGFLSLLVIYEIGRRYFSRTVALLAGVIFYTCPIPVWFSGVGKNDLGLILVYSSTFYLILRCWEAYREGRPESKRWLTVSILFLGIGIHLDYRGFIVLVVVALFLLTRVLVSRAIAGGTLVKVLFGTIIGASIIGSPWYIGNYIYTNGGSPVYPFMVGTFGGKRTHAFDKHAFELKQKYDSRSPTLTPTKSLWYYLSLPLWNYTIYGRNYDLARFNAKVTPLYLLLLPLYIFARKRHAARDLLFLGLGYIFISQCMRVTHTRYIAPSFPLLAVVAGYVVHEGFSSRWKAMKYVLGAVVVAVSLFLLYDNFITVIRHRSIEYVVATLPERDYLTLRSEIYPAARYINQALPEDARILFLSDERLYYCRKPALPLTATRLAKFVEVTGEHSIDEWNSWLERRGITHILYNPGFHKAFEQVESVSEVVDTFMQGYRSRYLKEVYNKYGIHIYAIQ